MNHGAKALDLEVRIAADSDFADLFEVKDALPKRENDNDIDVSKMAN